MERITDFASRLKEYRVSSGLTLSELEAKTKVPAQTLNRYELRQRVPKVDAAISISEALEINSQWLQGYDVPMERIGYEASPLEEPRKMVTELPDELKDMKFAFYDGGLDGLDEGDIDMLMQMANNMRKNKKKEESS